MEGYLTHIDGVSIREIADRYGTPVSVNSERIIRERCRELKENINGKIMYAPKANTLGAVCSIIRDEGLKAEVISKGEAWRALNAGFDPGDIMLNKDCADRDELEWCIENEILVNCGSLQMLRNYGEAVRDLWKHYSHRPSLNAINEVSVRINPGEGHGHHRKCSTGGLASKHGIWYTRIPEIKDIAETYALDIIGVHSHIGTGVDIGEWLRIIESTMDCAKQFKSLNFVDFGGGLPVPYRPDDERLDIAEFGKRLDERFERFCDEYGSPLEMVIEPGRYIVAESGSIITRVEAINETPDYRFALCDSGFNHLIRPALYGSYHPINVCRHQISFLQEDVVVAGPNCESGDVFTQKDDGTLEPRRLPALNAGDLVVLGNTGAYGETMSSNYCSQLKMPEILIDMEGGVHLIKEREKEEGLVRGEKLPDYLS
ncbi:MAG: diaminopimelate decarboxylase [Candidatus Woesearchaeota archaeon]